MDYSTLSIEIKDRIGHLKFIRPEQSNSMNRAFWQEFPQALRQLGTDPEIRVLVISGEGKHFCSGMDTEVFTQPDPELFQGESGRRGEAVRRLVLDLQACFNQMEQLRIPVLTAIQGGCIGGAVDLVCAADMRYCTENAYFTIKETAIGMTADLGTLQRMPKLIAPGLARELAYTARKMHADEAVSSGFVNACYPNAEAMLRGVMEIAAQIAQQSPLAVCGTKEMLNFSRDHSVEDSLRYMATWQAGMFQPADLMQSFSAMMQKACPEYEPLRGYKPLMQKD